MQMCVYAIWYTSVLILFPVQGDDEATGKPGDAGPPGPLDQRDYKDKLAQLV